MGRAPCCQKVGLKRGRWTSEEDQILINYIQHNGEGSWRSLPKNAGLLRCGKSCRLRWINYLRRDLKRGNISPQEEDLIIKLHATLGNRWSLIASQLPGRTDNEVKNHWNSHLRRSINSWRRPVNDSLPQNILDNIAKLMVKPNHSIKMGSKKSTAPTIKGSKLTTQGDRDESNHKPHTPGVCEDPLPNKCSWDEQSSHSISPLEGQQESSNENVEVCMESLLEGADDFEDLLIWNDEAVTATIGSSLLLTPQHHSLNDIHKSASLDLCFMNELPDFSPNHAKMDSSRYPTSSSLFDTATNQQSPSSLYTFDQLLNMSSDGNWDEFINTYNQDFINHELGNFMSYLWCDDHNY